MEKINKKILILSIAIVIFLYVFILIPSRVNASVTNDALIDNFFIEHDIYGNRLRSYNDKDIFVYKYKSGNGLYTAVVVVHSTQLVVDTKNLEKYNQVNVKRIDDASLNCDWYWIKDSPNQDPYVNVYPRDLTLYKNDNYKQLLYVNYDMKELGTENVFFSHSISVTPTPTIPVQHPHQQQQLAQLLASPQLREEMKKPLVEVVGLIPLLMGFLVLVIAFWKAYRLLRNLLSKA